MKELAYAPRNAALQSDLVRMAPVLIKEEDWVESKTKDQLKAMNLAEGLAFQELGRVFRCMEKFRAYLQPHGRSGANGSTVVTWEVCFPGKSRWKSGPKTPSMWKAVRLNYELNKKFPTFEMGLNGADAESLERLEQIQDQAEADRERKAEEAVREHKAKIQHKAG